MKRLAIALVILSGLSFGVQKSYSWFSSRDEVPVEVVEAGGLDVRLTLDEANAAYIYPSAGNDFKFSLGYTIERNSNVPTIIRVNQAGIHLKNNGTTLSVHSKHFDKIVFRHYKLTDECFKQLKHLSENYPEKYLDQEYLDSIGFVPFDISSPNYEVVPLVFDNLITVNNNDYLTTTPDNGLRLNATISAKDAFYRCSSGFSSSGFSIDELLVDPQSSNNLYLYYPVRHSAIKVTFNFELPRPQKPSIPITAEDLAPLALFDNSFLYSVITLDVTQDSLTDESGNNYLGDLKIVAIEDNAYAFRSVFDNAADDSLYVGLQPGTYPPVTITPIPTPTFDPFNMTVKHFGSASIPDETFSNLGATPDQYQIISCTDDQETQLVIDKLEKFDVEISRTDCYVEQTGNVISVQLDGDEKPGTVAVIQLLRKESNTCMLTVKVIK